MSRPLAILAVRHDALSPAGLVADRIAARGGVCVEVMPHEGDPLPDLDDGIDGIVLLGGAMGANDDEAYPRFREILDLVRAAHRAGRPVMGICLGAQLLARAFGARVRRHDAPELGFVRHRLTAAGARDPLLAGTGPEQWIVQWHWDTFDLPRGAELLMTGEGCRNQAFRLGAATYGFQFHLEATPEIVATWIDAFGPEIRRRHPGLPAAFERDAARHFPRQKAFTETVADRWLDLAEAARDRRPRPGRVAGGGAGG